jgi:glycosyltransferase involved in cell wall biosynthesis
MFSTYVPSEGFGGPSRIYHQRRVLESAGHAVTHVVVVATPAKGDLRPHDHVELAERPFGAPVDHIYPEVDLAARVWGDARMMARILDHVRGRRVDAILLEQPFLVDIVAKVASVLDVPVVYSCHNIEYRLRRDLERFQPLRRRPADRSDEVRELERAAVELSSRVTALCVTDQAMLRDEFGCESTVVPNGTTVSTMGGVCTDIPTTRDANFVFAGSAYWPNVEGFAEIATPSLAFLPPTTRVHVVGSVGPELLRFPPVERRYAVNESRMKIHGFLPMEEVVTLMRQSTATLVPVFVGEGSNLKSADALASGAPVIMTRRSTRGYEDVIEADDQGLTVVDDATQFRDAMLEAAREGRRTASVGSIRRDLLRWSSRLQPLVDLVESL